MLNVFTPPSAGFGGKKNLSIMGALLLPVALIAVLFLVVIFFAMRSAAKQNEVKEQGRIVEFKRQQAAIEAQKKRMRF